MSRGQQYTAFLESPLRDGIPAPPAAGASATMVATQHSWADAGLPRWWQAAGITEASRDYGATPHWVNDTDDDGVRIQQAIDDACDLSSRRHGFAVFVPHGRFGLARPLNLRGGCAALLGKGTSSRCPAVPLSRRILPSVHVSALAP